jgi:hypothetical protein
MAYFHEWTGDRNLGPHHQYHTDFVLYSLCFEDFVFFELKENNFLLKIGPCVYRI